MTWSGGLAKPANVRRKDLELIEDGLRLWPASTIMTPLDAPLFATMSPPGTRPAFDTRTSMTARRSLVRRVTPTAAEGLWPGMGTPVDPTNLGTLNYSPARYPRGCAFNSDNSYYAIVDIAQGSGTHILRSDTHQRYRTSINISSQFRWFNTDPDKIAYVNTAPDIKVYNVGANNLSQLKSFASFGYTEQAPAFCGGEGNQSRDDRYWPLCLKDSDGWDIVVWDRVTNSIVLTLPLNAPYGSANNIDWWGMSWSGDYLITCTFTAWTSGATSVPRGLNVWDRATGALLRTKYNGPGNSVLNHCDIGRDSDGKDVVVYVGPLDDGTAPDRHVLTWRLDGSDGATTRIQAPNGLVKTQWHLSAQAEGKAFICTFPANQASTTGIALSTPGHNQILAIDLNESQTVRLIGGSRHTNETMAVSSYHACSFANPRRDGRAVLARSGWSYTGTLMPSAQHVYYWESE